MKLSFSILTLVLTFSCYSQDSIYLYIKYPPSQNFANRDEVFEVYEFKLGNDCEYDKVTFSLSEKGHLLTNRLVSAGGNPRLRLVYKSKKHDRKVFVQREQLSKIITLQELMCASSYDEAVKLLKRFNLFLISDVTRRKVQIKKIDISLIGTM